MSHHKKLNIEASLSRSISQAPGLDFEKLAAMPVLKMTEHDYITRQQSPATRRNGNIQRSFKPLSIAVAGCLVMLICVTTWFGEFKSPESIIALDANQSVEIVTNKHKQILSVKAFDQDVQALLDEEHLNQTNLEDSVGVIITAMIKNGYLDESKSVVMVTVENQSTAKADDLADSLNQVIRDSATAENISATVVRQTVTPDQTALTEAEQYNVSTGKLNVMKELVVADSSLTMDALATMSLTDLLAVSKEKSVDLTKVIKGDEPKKETKDLTSPVTPTEDDPEVTISTPTTETTVKTNGASDSNDANGNNKEAEVSDPTVIAPLETPAVTSVEPALPPAPVVTPPEKETEAVDEEKKPLSETVPEEAPEEALTDHTEDPQ